MKRSKKQKFLIKGLIEKRRGQSHCAHSYEGAVAINILPKKLDINIKKPKTNKI